MLIRVRFTSASMTQPRPCDLSRHSLSSGTSLLLAPRRSWKLYEASRLLTRTGHPLRWPRYVRSQRRSRLNVLATSILGCDRCCRKSPQHVAGATIESDGTVPWIDIARWPPILNQCCSEKASKSFSTASTRSGRVIDPLRPRALKAFEEFFFSRARDVYPRYDFVRMNDDEYGSNLSPQLTTGMSLLGPNATSANVRCDVCSWG
jgi:hypothetical protein